MYRNILLLGLLCVQAPSWAKVCLFQELKVRLETGKSFSAAEENCENEIMKVNDRVDLNFAELRVNGLLASGKKMRLVWDAGNIPQSYLDKTYKDDTERAYFLETHASCSGDIYNPWFLFGVRADRVQISNFIFENIPDGLHIIKGIGTQILNNSFVNVCEDALTIRAGRNHVDVDETLIQGNIFTDGDDKVINNESGKVKIVGNSFVNCNRAIDTGNDDVYVKKKRGFVLAKENIFDDVKVPMRGGDMGKILSVRNIFKGKTQTLYAARTKGEVLVMGDVLQGSCDNLGLLTGNPRTVLNPADPKSKDIPEYQGPAIVRLEPSTYQKLKSKCKREFNPKSEAGKGNLEQAIPPLWPKLWEDDFFKNAPDNST